MSASNFNLGMFSHDGESQIYDFDLIVWIDEYVFRFDISMRNLHFVKIIDRFSYLLDNHS